MRKSTTFRFLICDFFKMDTTALFTHFRLSIQTGSSVLRSRLFSNRFMPLAPFCKPRFQLTRICRFEISSVSFFNLYKSSSSIFLVPISFTSFPSSLQARKFPASYFAATAERLGVLVCRNFSTGARSSARLIHSAYDGRCCALAYNASRSQGVSFIHKISARQTCPKHAVDNFR